MARAWFLRVLLNSSSFSAILRSISCLTWPSSSWALRSLISSARFLFSRRTMSSCSLDSSRADLRRNLSLLEELAMEYERTHAAACITEKRGKNFDKVVGEWKAKADDLMAELDAAHSEARNYSNERFRLKSALDESNEQLDIVRRENKNLADEIKDLLDQLGDGGRSIHELDKQRW